MTLLISSGSHSFESRQEALMKSGVSRDKVSRDKSNILGKGEGIEGVSIHGLSQDGRG